MRAYPFADMGTSAVINDELGGQELLVLFHLDSRTVIPYGRRVDGRTLTFYQVVAEGQLPVEFRDVETGTRWNMLGEAVDGPLTGQRLEPVAAYNSMWFAWSTFWPQTTVWAGGGIIEEPPITAVLEPRGGASAEEFLLSQNFPNPFNSTTQIQFALPVEGEASLRIYNTAGQLVRTLADGHHRAGLFLASWDGADESDTPEGSGIYHYNLEMAGGGFSRTRSMTLVR